MQLLSLMILSILVMGLSAHSDNVCKIQLEIQKENPDVSVSASCSTGPQTAKPQEDSNARDWSRRIFVWTLCFHFHMWIVFPILLRKFSNKHKPKTNKKKNVEHNPEMEENNNVE